MTMGDSDNNVDIEPEELVIGKPIMTRSGRHVKAGQGLMFRRAQIYPRYSLNPPPP